MSDPDAGVPGDDELWAALSEIRDPAGPPVNVVDLGLVYDLRHCGGNVSVKMTLITEQHPAPQEVRAAVRARLLQVPGVERATVELVWDPQWTHAMMSPGARRRLGTSASTPEA